MVTEFPKKIFETDQTDVWYAFDTRFKLPKCMFYLNIYTIDQNY